LRTPVTALRLQAQLVERAPTEEIRAQAIAEMNAGVERVQHLLVQLLELSRLDPEANLQKRERLALAELARSVVSHLNVKAENKGVDLGAEIIDEAWIEGDRYQLAILLDNLVDNAIRYNGPSGVIDVSVSNKSGRPTITVRDNGPGIPEDERERVFDRFYRGRDAQATADGSLGSGLGLAIVKTIADRHQAQVTLGVPQDGKGLYVSIAFPPA
jgi:signal transduction histidine kinase